MIQIYIDSWSPGIKKEDATHNASFQFKGYFVKNGKNVCSFETSGFMDGSDGEINLRTVKYPIDFTAENRYYLSRSDEKFIIVRELRRCGLSLDTHGN